ncbi:outer membrane protein assembly factor BamB [Derxia gummosa]|uniref:Outer membrane protein assembly factor BamB n=1 Tax=Derxia gummosa DSM 723 TaxID=1121388 RepID=A0A8B6X7U9_9BURK|nr:outer membrane protein assembly factor BamB [Derxia gummosa]
MARLASLRAGAFALAVAIGLAACGSTPQRVPADLKPIESSVAARTLWTAKLGEDGPWALAPALVDGTVLAASTKGRLARLDAATGRERWRVETGFKVSAGVGTDAATAVVGGPDGQVAAFALDTGKQLWKARVPAELIGVPAVANGMAVVRSSDSRLYGLDLATGERKWSLIRPVPPLTLRVPSGMVLAGDVLLAAFPGGRLLGVKVANGQVVFDVAVAQAKGTTELERVVDVVGTPVVEGSEVCAATYQGRIGCLNGATGQTIWVRDFSAGAGPAADVRRVYGVSEQAVVQAFARDTGTLLWTNDKLKFRDLAAPLSWGRTVVAGDYRGYLHFFDRETGNLIGRLATDGSAIRMAPVSLEPAARGFVVQTADGAVVAVATE